MPTLSDLMPNPLGKDIWRLHARNLREDAHLKQPYAARHAAAQFMASVPLKENACVAVYYPAGTELHTWPLVEDLRRLDVSVCLPVVQEHGKPLTFRRYDEGCAMEKGTYGIMAPCETSPLCHPDILVMPLLAFRRDGGRLGMGGGYYDRTLAQLRKERPVIAVGYAYAAQEMDKFPVERHDQPLNWIVTEREAIRVR